MDLRQLRYFIALAEHRSFVRAADAMVPFYPNLGSASDLAAGQDYTRHHLGMWI